MGSPTARRVSTTAIRARKGSRAEKIVCLTAYDYPTALVLDRAGVDIILVGDSLGMVVLGYENTLPVTMDEMLHHVKAVTRAKPRALVVADMPYLSYHLGEEDAVRNAGRFIKETGADCIKLEGGLDRVAVIRAIRRAEIPVMGHLGLTPQSVLHFGGYRVQGREPGAAERMVDSARALEDAGCFSLVLEGIPASLAGRITAAISIPTIGIGAGPGTDGQVLVLHDMLGLGGEQVPRFVRRYADLAGSIGDAVRRFADDVRAGRYPAEEETYPE